MKPNEPLTLEQTLEAVHQASEDSDLLDEVLAMSSEEVDQQLQKAGVDLVALDARMAAREAEIRIAQDRPAPVGAFSKKLAALLLAIGTFLGGIGTYVVETLTATAPALGPAVAFSAPPPSAAEQLRSRAFDACGRTHWQECLDDLDKAKAQDPDGDVQADVENARAMARAGLHR